MVCGLSEVMATFCPRIRLSKGGFARVGRADNADRNRNDIRCCFHPWVIETFFRIMNRPGRSIMMGRESQLRPEPADHGYQGEQGQHQNQVQRRRAVGPGQDLGVGPNAK